mgnify:CR=1 FL=1|jgi:hypothetical protein
MVLLRFLFEFALPWLSLRQGIRCNDGSTLDIMWAMALPWFRVCGKTNYAPMAVDVLFVNCALSQTLRSIWQRHRTMSLRGNNGRNIPWDQANEQMNKEVKCGLGTRVARHLIDPFILMLNGIRQIERKLRNVFGVGTTEDDDADKEEYYTEYCRTELQDVDAIVQALMNKLGTSHVELFADRSSNPFGTGAPWDDVANMKAGNAEYVRSHLKKDFNASNYSRPAGR